MTTLLYNNEGAVPEHTVIEEQMAEAQDNWAIEWEALRMLSQGKGGLP